MKPHLQPQLFLDLVTFDSCTISNAVDSQRARLQNVGFTGPGIVCRTKVLSAMVGVALTLKVRSSEPPMKPAFYLEHEDWWERIEDAPYPRVLVIEDVDAHPGRGSLVGPVHACILKALGFVGVVTTGAVRGTREFAKIGLNAFSGNVSPSHAFCHVVEMGTPVEVAGMTIETGEIVHGDRDGVVSIPATLADKMPEAARRCAERDRSISEFCASKGFSRAKLKGVIGTDTSRW